MRQSFPLHLESAHPDQRDDRLTIALPHWEEASGTLWMGPVLVKRLRPDAAHQRQILRAFQESAWSEVLIDPLPARGCRDRKARVRETVRALNQGQRGRLRLRFHAAREVLGYCWELIHE